AIRRAYAGRLRQLAYTDKLIRIKRHCAVYEVVAMTGPCLTGAGIAHMMCHSARARRAQGQVNPTFMLDAKLITLQGLADLVIANNVTRLRTSSRRMLEHIQLTGAKITNRLRRPRIVSMTINKHD